MKKCFGVITFIILGCSVSGAKTNQSWDVKCFSGGKLIYQGRSFDRPGTVGYSDIFRVKDNKIGTVYVSGHCVVRIVK